MEINLENWNKLFYPKSMAVVGASNAVQKWGFATLHNTIRGNYEGKIYAVNPKESKVCGLDVHKTLGDIPGDVDLVIVATPPATLPGIIKESIAKNVAAMVVLTAGFSEVGDAQKNAEDEMVELAREGNILMIGPNCQGVMCSQAQLFPQMVGVYPKKGNISILSQSGNIGGTMLHWGRPLNIGFSKFVSSGNEAMTFQEDVLEYYGHDDDTKVIVAYVEGMDHGRRFFEVAREVSKKKPIILLKGGKTSAGQRAAMSHTGAIASREDLFNAACIQAGIVKVDTLEELFDVGVAFSTEPLPEGNGIGIVTVGGGWGVLAADWCDMRGLDVVDLSDDAIKQLSEFLPSRWSRGNPVDLAAGTGEGIFTKCLEILLNQPQVHCAVQIGIGYGAWYKENLRGTKLFDDKVLAKFARRADETDATFANNLEKLRKEYGKPILSCTDVVGSGQEEESESLKMLRERSQVVYPSPERAVTAMAHIVKYAEFRRKISKAYA